MYVVNIPGQEIASQDLQVADMLFIRTLSIYNSVFFCCDQMFQ